MYIFKFTLFTNFFGFFSAKHLFNGPPLITIAFVGNIVISMGKIRIAFSMSIISSIVYKF